MKTYNNTKRTLCPHCKGDKTEMILVPVDHPRKFENNQVTCTYCDGEGVVVMQTTYYKLKEYQS